MVMSSRLELLAEGIEITLWWKIYSRSVHAVVQPSFDILGRGFRSAMVLSHGFHEVYSVMLYVMHACIFY